MLYPLIDYLCESLYCSVGQLDVILDDDKQIEAIINKLAKMRLFISYGNVTLRQVYPVDFSHVGAQDIMMNKDYFEGTLVEMYKEIDNYKLRFPHLPCLVATKSEYDIYREYFPIEVVKIML